MMWKNVSQFTLTSAINVQMFRFGILSNAFKELCDATKKSIIQQL